MKERFELEIKNYLQELLQSVAKQLSQEHNIPEDELMISINRLLDHSVKKCSKLTKQGHQCKYDAKIGEDLCTCLLYTSPSPRDS